MALTREEKSMDRHAEVSRKKIQEKKELSLAFIRIESLEAELKCAQIGYDVLLTLLKYTHCHACDWPRCPGITGE